jgi:RNA polymerase sigma-70 factor (ECF subfamily)
MSNIFRFMFRLFYRNFGVSVSAPIDILACPLCGDFLDGTAILRKTAGPNRHTDGWSIPAHESLTRIETIAESAWGGQPSLTERVGRLYIAHRQEILSFLTAQGLPAATAQDFTQEVFLKLLVHLRDGHQINSVPAWLFRVAANRAVDYWRRERRFVMVELDAGGTVSDTLETAEKPVDQLAAEEQRMRRLASEIGRLPKEHRMCVLLRSQGLRYREIAGILGVGVSTTADWLDAAVERLRRVVHD